MNRILLFCLLVLPGIALRAQHVHEFAHKNITHYSSKETKGFAQSWAVTQGDNGLMYFGNGVGVLEFDGTTWRAITLGGAIRTFYKSGNGTIYTGGDNLIGYLKPDSYGKMDFYSLLDSIPEPLRDFVAILSIYDKDGLLYFVGFKGIYIFRDNRFVKAIRPKTDFRFAFQIQQKIFVRQSGIGIMEIKADIVVNVPGGNFFADKPVYMMAENNKGQIIIGTSLWGLYTSPAALLKGENPRLDPVEFKTPANSFIIKNNLYHGIILNNNDIALATTLGGIIVIDGGGKVKNIFNKYTGLKIVNASAIYQDVFGDLWVALQNGLSKIEMQDPLGWFPEETVIPGLINTSVVFKDKLYAGTMEGLFMMEDDPDWLSNEKLYKVTRLNSDYNSVMQLKEINNELLTATRFNFYSIEGRTMRKLSKEEFGFIVYQYKKNPPILFTSNANGLLAYENKNGTWKILGQVAGISYEVRSMSETKDGDLWLNAFQGKMPRLRFNGNYLTPSIRWYDAEHGLPDQSSINVETDFDSLTILAGSGFYTYNGKTDRFAKDTLFPLFYKGDSVLYNNYCFFNRDLAYSYTNNGFARIKLKKSRSPEMEIIYPRGIQGQIFYMQPDTINNKIWFSSDIGLFEIDLNKIDSARINFKTVIRQILAGKDSLVFQGVLSDTLADNITVPFDMNSLTVFFSSLYFERQSVNEYSYMLVGLDSTWSKWTNETKVNYPFLPEGLYAFQVRSRNHYNHESETTAFTIEILPPWYRTWWAYFIFFVLTLTIIFLFIKWYGMRLKKANIRLEKTVRARTSEIENQKNEIELKNMQLQIINKELEKLSIVARETDNSIMIMDPSGKFEWINDGFIRLNQYDLKELIKDRADNILDYSKSPDIKKYFNECVNEKKTIIYEAEVIRKDGTKIWAQTTLSPVLSDDGHVSKIVAIDSDITRLKDVEQEVLKQKKEIEQTRDKLEKINSELEKLSIVARETDNVVMIMDKEGNYEWINESLKKMYGITPEELYAKKGRSLLTSSYTDEIEKIWQRCMTEKKSATYQALATNSKGKTFWTQTTITPIMDSDGNVIKVIGIDTDISKIKKAEEKIKQQSEELSKSLVELQKTTGLISQSIEYAEKIQAAILHNEEQLSEIFPESFVLLMPKDVVSGDFCWFYKHGTTSVLVAADCTGHGVPGAFMSLIGSSILNEIIRENGVYDPAKILSKMNEKIIGVLHQKQQSENIQEDGMDVAVCNINTEKNQLTFAGANMPLTLYNEDGIVKVQGDLFSIGGSFSTGKNVRFKNQIFNTSQFNGLFLFSDGFQDQFGGGRQKKFMADAFTNLLREISMLPPETQKVKLCETFSEWKGEVKQIDDVLVIGCKFSKK